MRRMSLDVYDDMPRSMKSYLRNNGWHFNRKACEYATSLMHAPSDSHERMAGYTRDQVDEMLKRSGVALENDIGYDVLYVANMCKSDYYGRSIQDEQHLALIIKDIVDDADAGDGEIMRCWYAKTVARGIPVEWEDML